MINPVSLFDVDTTPKPIDSIIIEGKRASLSNADIASQAGPGWSEEYVILRWQELREHWSEDDCLLIERNRAQGNRPEAILETLHIPRALHEIEQHIDSCWPSWQEELLRYLCVEDVTGPRRTDLPSLAQSTTLPPLLLAYLSAQNRLSETLAGCVLPSDVLIGEFEADEVYALRVLPDPPRTYSSIENRIRQLRGRHWNSRELQIIWRIGQAVHAEAAEDWLAQEMSAKLRPRRNQDGGRSKHACRHRYLRLVKKSKQIMRRMQLEAIEALATGSPIDSRRDLSSRMTGYIRGQDSENHDGLMKFMIHEGTQKSLVTFDAGGFEGSIYRLKVDHDLTREAAIVRYLQEQAAELVIKGRRRQAGVDAEPKSAEAEPELEPAAESVADPVQPVPALEEGLASLNINSEATEAEAQCNIT